MTKSLILHVGPHKTGSTYIQHQCLLNRKSLSDRSIFYPEFGQSIFGHHPIADAIRSGMWKGSELHSQLETALENNRQVILSSESFVLASTTQLRIFLDSLNGANIRVYYFARHPTETFPSLWQEFVKHGASYSFSDFMAATRGHVKLFAPLWCDHAQQIRNFIDVFGENNIRILNYNSLRGRSVNLYERLIEEAFGVRVGATNNNAENTSLAKATIEIVRTLNGIYKIREGKPPGIKVRKAFFQNAQNFAPDLKFLRFFMDENWATFELDAASSEFDAFYALANHHIEMTSHDTDGARNALNKAGAKRDIPFYMENLLVDKKVRNTIINIYDGLF